MFEMLVKAEVESYHTGSLLVVWTSGGGESWSFHVLLLGVPGGDCFPEDVLKGGRVVGPGRWDSVAENAAKSEQ